MDRKRKLYLLQACLLTFKAVEAFILYDYCCVPARDMWVHQILLERDSQSEFKLAEELLDRSEADKCVQYFRMNKDKFYELLALVEPLIMKKNTNWRKAIPARWRLIVTLRYLATGASQLHLSFSFRVGHSTIGVIIRECCDALWKVLVPNVLKPPSASAWQEIERGFYELWQCPNCIGALDGKHIRIKAPPNSGSLFFNYKGFFSVVLLAVCDAQYRFVLVDIGNTGRHSDGGIFSHSEFGRRFQRGELNIPDPKCLPNCETLFPYFFSADDAFPLTVGMIKPYPGKGLSMEKKIFNYRLSRARRVVENAFGILAVRWQVFYKTINCDPDLATKIIQACVVLHNFLQSPLCKLPRAMGDSLQPDGSVSEGSWRSTIPSSINMSPVRSLGSNFCSRNASFYRDELMRYFLGSGAVPWQGNL